MNLLFLLTALNLFFGSKTGIDEDWEEYKRVYKKQYSSLKEEYFRKSLFDKELEYMKDHNEKFRKGLVTYEMGLNEFTIYTQEERRSLIGALDISDRVFEQNITENPRKRFFHAPPSAVDWREKGVINPVKNQGQCGSCWIFAAISALEAAYAIQKGMHVSLSEQQLVNCLHGCEGGWTGNAFTYIRRKGGVNYDRDYPYTAKEDQCRYNAREPHVTVNGWWGYQRLPSRNEEALKEAVANVGPIAVSIEAVWAFHSYKSGVFYSSDCTGRINHAVTVVGYGQENGLDYWLVRNSWGPDWGDHGYVKMARNRGNNCDIASRAIYPTI